MLSSYLPEVQRYESSRIAWESLLCGWEGTARGLPLPGATPESIQDQIENIKVCKLCYETVIGWNIDACLDLIFGEHYFV